MTSEKIKDSQNFLYPYVCDDFWISEIAYQLAIANELQVERNKLLKESVDLQRESTNNYVISLQNQEKALEELIKEEKGKER